MLIDWALQPMGMIALALLMTLLSWLLSGAKPILPFFFFCTSCILFFTLSMPWVANTLVYRLENIRQNPAECQDQQTAPLVVLGGGIDLYVNSTNPYEVLNPDTLIRTLRAPTFASATTHYYLLGGGGEGRTLAQAMKSVLVQLNVDATNITTEPVSKSTFENAQALVKLLPPSDATKIQLLTSKLHVNRASATFEKAGYQVCHIGVDSQYSVPKLPVALLPYLSGLQKTTFALHEWMALTVYRIKGYL